MCLSLRSVIFDFLYQLLRSPDDDTIAIGYHGSSLYFLKRTMVPVAQFGEDAYCETGRNGQKRFKPYLPKNIFSPLNQYANVVFLLFFLHFKESKSMSRTGLDLRLLLEETLSRRFPRRCLVMRSSMLLAISSGVLPVI